MSTKTTITLAAAILLSSALAAAAQAPRYYDYVQGSSSDLGAPPLISDYPATAGGGSVGYNQNLRYDW